MFKPVRVYINNTLCKRSQLGLIHEYIEERNWSVEKIYIDNHNESSQLKLLLREVQKFDIVLLTDITHISSEINELIKFVDKLNRKKAILVSLNPIIDTSSLTGCMTFNILKKLSH